MTKYARPVPVDAQTRMYDVFDTATIEPRPPWGKTDDALLSRIFENQKAAWVKAGQWFVEVLQGVQDGAVHAGDDHLDPASYLNPDGSDGNGKLPDKAAEDVAEVNEV